MGCRCPDAHGAAAGAAAVRRGRGCPEPDTASSASSKGPTAGHSQAPTLSRWHLWESAFKKGQNDALWLWERGVRTSVRATALQMLRWEEDEAAEEVLQTPEQRLPCGPSSVPKDCNPWEGPMLEQLAKDCIPWEGPRLGTGEQCEERQKIVVMAWPQVPFSIPLSRSRTVGEVENFGRKEWR